MRVCTLLCLNYDCPTPYKVKADLRGKKFRDKVVLKSKFVYIISNNEEDISVIL